MQNSLAAVINTEQPILLVGDSASARFPAMSFDCYMRQGKAVSCVDLGGRTTSRGASAGHAIYPSFDDLPPDWGGELAILWVPPYRAAECTRAVAAVGCTKVWYSFHTVTPEAISTAAELGVEVVEAGRCPVFFLKGPKPLPCRLHTAAARLFGMRSLPPQTDASATRRELL
jgi:predicted CoA-binding protein